MSLLPLDQESWLLSSAYRKQVLKDLTAHPGWQLLLEELQSRRTQLRELLLRSALQQMVETPAIAGQLTELERLISLPEMLSAIEPQPPNEEKVSTQQSFY